MFDRLQALGIGIISFAIIIGVGTIVLQEFGDAVGGTANTTVAYMTTELGQNGLAGWTPAIVAISIGMLFLGMFLFNREERTY